MPRSRLSLVLVALSATWCLSATSIAQEPVVLEVYYDDLLTPADPDYDEVLAYVRYPLGSGPTTLGYPAGSMPAMLTARGGNSNTLVPGQPSGTEMTEAAVAAGFVDVTFNYPLVDAGEDYRVAADGAALLIQYLRANAESLNIRPDQIVVQARSFGTVVCYSVALGRDRADPTHPDPVRRESSRMDYYAPRFGPSTLTCFSDQLGPWASALSMLFFPDQTFLEASDEQRLQDSAVWWLLNPWRFERTSTPPLFVSYTNVHDDLCGEVTDVHSGLFGELMLEAMDDFARQTGDHAWRAQCGQFDKETQIDSSSAILAWAIERVAEDFGGLYLSSPGGGPGGDASLTVFGAVGGNPVSFFSGVQPGTFPIPGCPDLEGQLLDFTTLGTSTALPNGLAQLSFPVDLAAVGQTIRFHAVDLVGCESSNVVTHVWQ